MESYVLSEGSVSPAVTQHEMGFNKGRTVECRYTDSFVLHSYIQVNKYNTIEEVKVQNAGSAKYGTQTGNRQNKKDTDVFWRVLYTAVCNLDSFCSVFTLILDQSSYINVSCCGSAKKGNNKSCITSLWHCITVKTCVAWSYIMKRSGII